MPQPIGSAQNAYSLHRQKPPSVRIGKVEVDAYHPPAIVEIRTRLPYMDADWDRVWEEIGYSRLYTQLGKQSAEAQREAAESTLRRVRNGLRIRNIHIEPGNIYGKIALETYLESKKRDIQLTALPKFGVQIDVRIYPPEIKVKTHVLKGGSGSS